MLSSQEANCFLVNLSGRTCDISYENGEIVISGMPDGWVLYVKPAKNTFSYKENGIKSEFEVEGTSQLKCARCGSREFHVNLGTGVCLFCENEDLRKKLQDFGKGDSSEAV